MPTSPISCSRKATAREKEFAIRSTLGARRGDLIRQLMVESLLLAFTGAAVGCGFALVGLKGLVSMIPQFTFPDEVDIRLNLPVLAATLGAAIPTALLFGLVPALGASQRDLSEPLKTSGRGNSGFRRGRLRNALIVSEVALSLVLLAGAGLLIRTFPPFGGIDSDFDLAGKTHTEKWKGEMILCSPGMFQTLGIRLLRGRLLSEQDIAGSRKVATVNQAFAAKYFAGEDPIGKRVKLAALENAPEPVANPWFEIVGVTSDIKNHGVRETVLPEVHAPYSFASYAVFGLLLRTAGNPNALVKSMNGEIWAMDKNIVPQFTSSLDDALDLFEFSKPRFGLTLFGVFALIGLVLVTLGVYSVISYTVTQQSHEIGIRTALGATAGNVRAMVIRTGLQFVIIGIAVGLALAVTATRVLASEFFGVSPSDPLTLLSVVVVLIAIGLVACYLPSRRATRVDPVISLRYE